ncbi:hypothetical protein TH63_16725 [Rufibacter radiotolerans]|uniref:histidine kinase n=1 Tax=Rufibacter radiotolerans TaxID=1379910 RepID=A0A0H4VM41_9BACT|nr:HAMP domain-containing sensor histidine kinase [Rufibacter radiotolerans]AKQ46905.1 hypothetical protein TH63_16725 [Rufibacter radiotolerans]
MQLYSSLSRIGFLKSYSVKFLFVAFLGIHIPLIGIIFFIVLNKDHHLTAFSIITYTLILTLVATGLTLVILNQLIKPIQRAKKALRSYLDQNELPKLPTYFTDEVGILLQDIQLTVTSVDNLLNEKKDLVSMLSHDLRTPTITMLDTVRLLQESPSERMNLAPYLANLQQVGQKQLDLMDSVLSLLRQDEWTGQTLKKTPVMLGPMIRSAILSMQMTLVAKRLQIVQEIPPKLQVNVEAASFEQVLNNLLVNAVKFSHPGQTISIQAEEKEGNIYIRFRDQGMGFAPETGERLFDRFTKYQKVGTAGEPSNGIGLFLCQKTMQKHGGSLSAQSAGMGQGATFTIELPKK